MKKYVSHLFTKHPFTSTFGAFFSIVLLLFFASKQHTDQVIEEEDILYFESKTGYKMNPKQGYSYESIRAFNGDGYSIWTYDLSDEDAAYFNNPDSLMFIKYPEVGEYRKHWKHRTWKRGPFDGKDQQYLHLALDVAGSYDRYKIELTDQWFGRIRKMLSKKDCLYAFNFKEHEPRAYPGNVDFYIIFPIEKIFILINHNA